MIRRRPDTAVTLAEAQALQANLNWQLHWFSRSRFSRELGESSMNCVELQASLAEIEDGSSADQRAHLKTCPECSALVAELDLIIATAPELSAAEEPSPRVWNSIEIACGRRD